MKKQSLTELLQLDLAQIVDDFELLVSQLPILIKTVGVNFFIEKMEFTKPAYYRRLKKPEIWTIEELKKAASLFKDHGLGKS